jgi:hypothetical protein
MKIWFKKMRYRIKGIIHNVKMRIKNRKVCKREGHLSIRGFIKQDIDNHYCVRCGKKFKGDSHLPKKVRKKKRN